MANSSNVISESTKYVTIRIRVIIRNVIFCIWLLKERILAQSFISDM